MERPSIQYIFRDSLVGIPVKGSNYTEILNKHIYPFKTKVVSTVEVPKTSPLLGVEVEIENCRWLGEYSFPTNAWTVDSDGSLRNNGMELISRALSIEDQKLALSWLYTAIESLPSTRKPVFSWRTSVHAHVSVRDLTDEEFHKFVLLYLMFEKSLFRYCSEERRNGNFSVPLMESEEFLHAFFVNIKRLERKRPAAVDFKTLLDSWDKYSALGAFRLRDLGTLEFRHLEGTYDINKVVVWLCFINCLYNAALKFSLKELLDIILQLNTSSTYTEFKDNVFQEYSQYLNTMQREDLINSVCKIKEELFFTPPSRVLSPRKTVGITKYLLKLEERKKKQIEQDLQEYQTALLRNYLGGGRGRSFGGGKFYIPSYQKDLLESINISWNALTAPVEYIPTTTHSEEF